MSAEQPEVGDVWQRKLLFERTHIVQVSKNAVRCQIGKIKFKTIPKEFFLDAYGFYTEYLNGNPFNFLLSVKPLNVIGNIHQNEDLLKGTIKCI